MGFAKNGAAALAAAALFAGTPASAMGNLETAEKLRRLDIMLMVTSLRCRFGADNFQADYDAFATHHLDALNTAARDLTAELARRNGAAGAKRALDKMSTGIANGYGMGHPRLGCGDLKRTTQALTSVDDPAALAAAADQLIDGPQDSVLLVASR